MSTTEASRVTTLALTRALAAGDVELFDRAAAGIDEDVRSMLWVFLVEAISKEFVIYTPADAEGFDVVLLLRMQVALARYADARARIGVRAALEPLVRVRP